MIWTICSTVKPCASMIASVQPSRMRPEVRARAGGRLGAALTCLVWHLALVRCERMPILPRCCTHISGIQTQARLCYSRDQLYNRLSASLSAEIRTCTAHSRGPSRSQLRPPWQRPRLSQPQP
jgi:hypothetical protein